MDEKELKNIFVTAVNTFLEKDKSLLQNDTHEQSISHRIAIYLECLLKNVINYKDINVDCEYNRYKRYSKINKLGKYIRPDIIVHNRNSDKNNLLVVEIKKKSSNEDEDIKRLKELTNSNGEYKYKLGVFLSFKNENPEYKWYQNG